MRLHALTLEAFGPFPGREHIDFDDLDHGILLVNGPTGAGKSSLLDAVAFALFGDVPGVRRALRQSLRSHHAAPHAAPRVELVFSVGTTRWRITRAPQWDAPKRRGSGTTNRPASVRLEIWRGGQWHLVSARIDEAAETIKDTLGMGLDQFAQVVLLPQGEFAQFLRARPEDRRTLLERLFDVGRFDAVERWFADARATRVRAGEVSRQSLEQQMSVVSDTVARLNDPDVVAPVWNEDAIPEIPERLRALLAQVRNESSTARSRAGSSAATARNYERVVERAGTIVDLAAAHERAGACLDAWPQHEVDAMKCAIDAASLVSGVLRLDERRQRAEIAVAEARGARDAAARALASRTLDLPDARRERADLVLLTSRDVEAYMRALHALTVLLPGCAAAAREVRDAIRLAGVAASDSGRRREQEQTTRERLGECEEQLAAARCALAAAPDAAARLGMARRARQSLNGAPRQRQAMQDAADAREHAAQAFVEAEQHAVALRRRRLEGIAAELGTDLVDGEPCPVCGSCEHPTPARAADAAPSPEEIAAAEQEALRANERRLDAERAGAAAEQTWQAFVDQLQERLDEAHVDDADGLGESSHGEGDHGEGSASTAAPGPAALHAPLSAATVIAEPSTLDPLVTALESLVTARLDAEREARRAESARDQAHAEAAHAMTALAGAEAHASAAEKAALAARERLAGAHALVAGSLAEVHDAAPPRLVREPGPAWPDLAPSASGAGADGDADERSRILENVTTQVDQASGWAEREMAQARETQRLLVRLAELETAAHTAEERHRAAEAELADELVAKGYEDVAAARAVALDDDALAELRATWQHAIEARAAARATLDDPVIRSAALTPLPNLVPLRRRAEISARRAADATEVAARWGQAFDVLDSLRHRVADAVRTYVRERAATEELSELANTFGGTGENTYRMRLTSYVLAAHLEAVTAMANERLHHMTDGRYQLGYTDERAKGNQRSGLGLRVIDAWTGRERDTATLSGGEAFMASLALALGLGDAVRADSGGMELHTLFVDEGFGSLDADTLEQVMEVLDGLREGGRLVGVVSHVSELRARIPTHVEVRKTSEGSTVHTRVAARADATAIHERPGT